MKIGCCNYDLHMEKTDLHTMLKCRQKNKEDQSCEQNSKECLHFKMKRSSLDKKYYGICDLKEKKIKKANQKIANQKEANRKEDIRNTQNNAIHNGRKKAYE